MGTDRAFESRFISESEFWPARALLERARARLVQYDEYCSSGEPPDASKTRALVEQIDALLKRTKQT